MPLTRPEKLVNSKSTLLPTPQILGLGDLAKAPHEMPSRGRRKWIKETDSAYIKLAKQGGQPDLLKHYTPVAMKSSPAPCAAPDWYLHCSNPPATEEPRSCISSIPDYMIHKEFKADDHHGNSYKPRRGPFDFDTKSVWQRDAEDKENAEKKKVKLPAINPKYPSRMLNVSTNKEFSGKNKLSFPPMPAQRKSEAVNFSKLISNGYGTDWFQQCTGGEKKIQETSENSEQYKDSEPSQSESAPARNELEPSFQGYNK
ncbi:PREDICTED: uncharacterized protein C7orf57 homolog [Chlamydotis macqueenii]|uniref:uncharacterized protein C7orf57 homolog n=1 Tax=Chlamydotis macqueenii TaxID=187382 RepID=UPI0005295CCA|nr:PREDICTED: uncharacterized protein C7orf57 homolog [Chlamydotis macqueenii]